MLLAERLVLLLLDPKRGEWRVAPQRTPADELCATALLVQLIAQHRIAVHGGRLVAVGQLPSSHALLDGTLAVLAHQPLAPAQAVIQVARHFAPLRVQLCEGLFRRDLLHRERDTRFLRRARLRYPLRSLQARNEAIAAVHAAAGTAPAGVIDLGLLLLLDLAGRLADYLDADAHERAVQRLLELGHAAPRDEALQALVCLRAGLIDG